MGGKILFSHGTHHSKGVCILLDPAINNNVEYFFSNNTGRIVLITTHLNGVKPPLCNIYAPNNQSEQLEFVQELTNYTVDKSEMTNIIIIHQTHYERSDWSRAFNQFTIACELDMINAISAADNALIMSSSTSAWLLSPLECSPQKQNG